MSSQFIVYAVERAQRLCLEQSERLRTPLDPYGGLMWAEDAELLGQAIELLRANENPAVVPAIPLHE